jgi:hypothetical protein
LRKAQADVPRWRRNKPLPGPVVTIPVAALQQAEPVAARAAFRFRHHLVPFWWGIAAFACAVVAHAATPVVAFLLAVLPAAGIIACTRQLRGFRRHAWQAMAYLTLAWVATVWAAGLRVPVPALLLVSWACVAAPWVKHHRWRPQSPETPKPPGDYDTWNQLAAEKKWNAHLGAVEPLPGGGRRYPIQADGIKTTISNVTSGSENVAGAWHKPMTEAYVERSPDGITSRGSLTILGRDTLMRVREWDGTGIDPATGLARAGRYADGTPVSLKFFTRRYGTRHALVSGTTGSGKSQLLDLLIFIALTCGYMVPIVLDPQEGQSLPYWQGRCLYAAGEDQCRAMLKGLEAGMLDRSRYLASLRWDDDGIPMRGMGFFDYELTRLPMPVIFFDEAHLMLKGDTKLSRETITTTVNIARLARKTGMALWLATHIPSLADLGGEQALRDMLVGGNVVSLRTANRVAGGMVGLEKDPFEIPRYFTDGKETYGLGYAAGPDNRPDAPMRVDLLPKAMRRQDPRVPVLDDRFREAMDAAMRP